MLNSVLIKIELYHSSLSFLGILTPTFSNPSPLSTVSYVILLHVKSCICIHMHNYISFNKSIFVAYVYVVSGLTTLSWITKICLIPGRNKFFFSQYSLVTCSSLSRERTLWDFPLHFGMMSVDIAIVPAVLMYSFLGETHSPQLPDTWLLQSFHSFSVAFPESQMLKLWWRCILSFEARPPLISNLYPVLVFCACLHVL